MITSTRIFRARTTLKKQAAEPVRTRTKVLLGAGLITLGAFGIAATVGAAAHGKTTTVLVAISTIPKGSVIEKTELATAQVAMPARLAAEEAMPSLNSVLGATASVAIRPNEIVTSSLLSPRRTLRTLRTMSIGGLDPANLAASGIVPGARVDVVVTYGTGINATTETVATSIQVSAITPESSGIGATQGDQVSLVIPTLIEGLAIAQASSAGKISLINSTGVAPARTLPVYPPYVANPTSAG